MCPAPEPREITMYRRAVLCGVLILCGPFPQTGAAQNVATWKARLDSEPVAKWEEYKAWSRRLQGTMKARITEWHNGQVIADTKIEKDFKQSPAAIVTAKTLERTYKGKPDHFNQILATNSQYTFKLIRKDAARDWALTRYDADPRKSLTQRAILLRAYPNNPVARYVIRAKAKWSIAM
jgi:hypothetical protein